MNPAELRLQLLASGFSPLPLCGKIPTLDKWQKRTETSAGDIDIWTKVFPQSTNTGFLTFNTPTLDIDVRSPEAATAIEELVRSRFEDSGYVLVRVGNAPKRAMPFRTDTPFPKIVAKLIDARGKADDRLELLCQGQQLAAFGIHPDTGKPYSWRPCGPGRVKREDLPHITANEAQALIDDAVELLITEHGYSKPARTSSKANGYDGATGTTDWTGYFANLIDHDALASFAMSLIASGMHGGAACNMLRAAVGGLQNVDAERKQRRLNEIADLVRSAESKRSAKGQSRPVPEPTLPSHALRTMQFPPIKYVVPGVIVEGLTLLAGKPKVGKSWLLLHAAIAVARGGFTLGEIRCQEGDTLYCALEDNLRRLQDRMTRLLGMHGAWPERLHFQCFMPRLSEGGLDFIRAWIATVDKPRLVIIDTLAMVRPPKGREETAYASDYNAVLALRELAAEHGVAVVVVHHQRKMAADDAFDTISGTLGLTGAPDTILVLNRDSSGTVVLHGRGRDIPEVEKAITFNPGTCTWTIAGEVKDVRATTERKAVLAAMAEIGAPASPAEIASTARMKAVNVRRLLLRMAQDGLVGKEYHGTYSLPK